MWIFNREGFFSVVEGDSKDQVSVRARFRVDLQKLKAKMGLNGRHKIIVTPAADYRFRMIVDKEAWAAYLKRAAERIDYTNFKNSVPARHRLYLDVWWVMKKAQDEAAKGSLIDF
jgi:hypothetical protein